MLIATDLDGTLLGPESTLTARTIEAVAQASAAGIHVIAATGRSWRSALAKVEPSVIRYVVCSNGGLIWDRELDDVLLHRPFVGTDAAAVVAAVHDSYPDAGFGWETPAGFDFDPVFLAHCPQVDEVGMGEPVGPFTSTDEVTKLFICLPGRESAELQRAVRAALPPIAQASSSAVKFVETTAADVDKATTVGWLAAHLNVARTDVVALGDQLNDVSMLTWAGRGIAMGNAHPDTIAAADETTDSNSEDGAAAIIERYTREQLASHPSDGEQ